jgi:hypothetical protein
VTELPVGTIATTDQPSLDCSVRRSARLAASYDETLIDENSCMSRTLYAMRKSDVSFRARKLLGTGRSQSIHSEEPRRGAACPPPATLCAQQPDDVGPLVVTMP